MAGKEAMHSQFIETHWAKFTDREGRSSCCFLTYFKSKDALIRALRQLSFADFSTGSLVLPDGMKVQANVITDQKRIVLTYFLGMFRLDQAHEVIRVFNKQADHRANKKQDLDTLAEEFLAKLKKEGKGAIVVAF